MRFFSVDENGNFTTKFLFGKLLLWKFLLGKLSIWEVAVGELVIGEVALGKLSAILLTRIKLMIGLKPD